MSNFILVLPSIQSPTDGIINQINFRTENAYVRSGEVLLEIVPTGKSLVVDAEVDPKDIADIVLGDEVKISLTAYDPTRYGRMDGVVQKISADSIKTLTGFEIKSMAFRDMRISWVTASQYSALFLFKISR